MRSLFHFPFPCTTTLAATVPLQPEMCHRPHPAPVRRSPALLSAASPLPGPALTGPRPTVTRSQGARHAAPPSLPRAAARSHRAPSPEYRPAAARTHWARLVHIATIACRRPHLIYPTACHHPHPPMSPPSRFRAHRPPLSRPSCAAVLHVLRFAVRIAPTACRHPRHPPISLLALRRPRGPSWQEPRRMHPLLAECAKKAPFLAISARNACFSRSRWQHPRPMHPFPGAIGRFRIHGARILPPRAHFRVEEPEITHGAKMLPAPRGLSAAAACGPAEWALRHAAAACDTRHGRTGFAPCGVGLACLPHAPPPCHLACARRGLRSLPSLPRSSPPSCTRRASPPASRPPRAAIRRRPRSSPPSYARRASPPSCCPRRRISLPARRTHPASRADPPRPGNKRNNTSNSMRA